MKISTRLKWVSIVKKWSQHTPLTLCYNFLSARAVAQRQEFRPAKCNVPPNARPTKAPHQTQNGKHRQWGRLVTTHARSDEDICSCFDGGRFGEWDWVRWNLRWHDSRGCHRCVSIEYTASEVYEWTRPDHNSGRLMTFFTKNLKPMWNYRSWIFLTEDGFCYGTESHRSGSATFILWLILHVRETTGYEGFIFVDFANQHPDCECVATRKNVFVYVKLNKNNFSKQFWQNMLIRLSVRENNNFHYYTI